MATHTAQIPCSVTPQLHAQLSQVDPSEYRTALTNYMNAPTPTNPVTRELLIKLRDEKTPFRRSLEIMVNIPKDMKEELKSVANREGLTMAAVVRRALYEYTKPENPDPIATYDGWGDAKKS